MPGTMISCSNPMSVYKYKIFGPEFASLRIYPCLVDAIEKKKYKYIPLKDLAAKLLKDIGVFKGELLEEFEEFPEGLDEVAKSIIDNAGMRSPTQVQIDREALKAWYAKYLEYLPLAQDQPDSQWSEEKLEHMQWLFR